MQFRFLFILILFLSQENLTAQIDPVDQYGKLFQEVQLSSIFEDSKTFPDCIPLHHPDTIIKRYKVEKAKDGFVLKEFVLRNFQLPPLLSSDFITDTSKTIKHHIERLWPVLTRDPDTITNSSLIPLPFPYMVPGGRFREIYYWDSYFTMLGLQASCKKEMIQNMVDNFSYLISKYGFIPNGNRTYYLSRSQPPFFSLMVKLLSDVEGKNSIVKYLPSLEKEYLFWTYGKDSLNEKNRTLKRVVWLDQKTILNRYWDDLSTARPESYKEDILTALSSQKDSDKVFRNIRAACESGWDFSSRWLADGKNLSSIHTTEIIPVDLNALIYHLETILAQGYSLKGDQEKSKHYSKLAERRKKAIKKYCWDKSKKIYTDYDFIANKPTGSVSLATSFPLFFNIANKKEAKFIKEKIMDSLFFDGGLAATNFPTKQQWDYPNGWAPLQWISIKGLLNYGYKEEAKKIAFNWKFINKRVFYNTGKMLEKYNVSDITLEAGGGEYPLQDGFGWTNGVYLRLEEILK